MIGIPPVGTGSGNRVRYSIMVVVIAVGRYRVILYCRIVERCYIKQSAPFWAVDPGRGVFVNALNISFTLCAYWPRYVFRSLLR